MNADQRFIAGLQSKSGGQRQGETVMLGFVRAARRNREDTPGRYGALLASGKVR